MTDAESDFWVDLEFRLSAEFERSPEPRHGYWWCDGFIPESYLLDGPEPRITGRVWIDDGPRQTQWTFSLRLPKSTREAIDWASLLPPKNMTGWMSLDENGRSIEIDPAAASPTNE